ncbi:hypothetical protein R4P64_33150 [Rhodococcus sp. IEGM 1366]|uniref:hypothetical protein n=1 Tax=Rhodococcus sp. IEGM 1366 TaxID=3082223 RepID=UPI002954A774|nr:hypothetical protein [Rhodococcus sp. IEGM 1366]MDV8071361.1 hypothetical protein [Rhodococcus sp. IEGM 1366]
MDAHQCRDGAAHLDESGDRPVVEHEPDGKPTGRVWAAEMPATRTTVGPCRIVVADSSLPMVDEMMAMIAHDHSSGRPVAVHCVCRESLLLLLVALEEASSPPGDRMEHTALIPVEMISELPATSAQCCYPTLLPNPDFSGTEVTISFGNSVLMIFQIFIAVDR